MNGHGAIWRFYGEFTGGKYHEIIDFSDPKKFPKKIVKAIKNCEFVGIGHDESFKLLSGKAAKQFKELIKPMNIITNERCNELSRKIQRTKIPQKHIELNDEYYRTWNENFYNVTKIFWDIFRNKKNRSPAWI